MSRFSFDPIAIDQQKSIDTPLLFEHVEAVATRKPAGTKVILFKTGRSCYVEIPPTQPKGWVRVGYLLVYLLFIVGGWNLGDGLGLITNQPGSRPGRCKLFCGLVALLSGASLLTDMQRLSSRRSVVHLGRSLYAVWQEYFHLYTDRRGSYEEDPDPAIALGSTYDLPWATLGVSEARIMCCFFPWKRRACIMIGPESSKKCFGEGLTEAELNWILEELNATIKQAKIKYDPLHAV